MVTVLRSILTILSAMGIRMNRPGPLALPCTLPSLKITPRSYSLTILMALSMTETTIIAIITTKMDAKPTAAACTNASIAYIRISLPLAHHVEVRVMAGQLNRHHLHHPSVAETHHRHLAPHPYHRLAISRVGFLGGERQHGPPPLAMHENPPRRLDPDGAPDGSHLADHPLLAGDSRPPLGGLQGAQ